MDALLLSFSPMMMVEEETRDERIAACDEDLAAK
jgi:hypothetical protein